ncbi:YncE family protein [Halalkalibacterium halodurans]|uniref:BH1943 protein n=1 Tax=Halalkalibacterium halodurans (strain ATCC BAA-125 / DSM 18197 / FERM 7344 / JCM 9153 / C-125) TaxID=272558 RepID=Q9KBI4_HALH5|nr:YncE family protein [Halalkalibacterium halodurans]MED4082702.1 YncE family protein [Halalkalibacterium halodurans]MED4085902.1 YncE family protein [Halalkalibacterium halodurans]MED4106870.1 YncE family protein [Halalkalibacterium halodurans]MED4109780.1 YncE family protein [Halalkalibacterium halodurans]MED4149774.1 YncE family protein [Halalkalibacterium halodurans]
MNQSRLICFVALLFVLSGCQGKPVTIPEEDGPMVVVSHIKESTFSFISKNKMELLETEESPYPLTAMVDIEGGQIVVTSQTEDTLFLFDTVQGKILPFITLNKGLTVMEFDRAKRMLFVADTLNDEIIQIDVDKREVQTRIAIDCSPTDLQVIDDLLFILSSETSTVFIYDMRSETMIQSFSVTERPAGMFYDGSHLWIGGHGPYGDLNKRIFAYNIKTGVIDQEVEVGLMPITIYQDQHDTYVYVLCHGDDALYKVDLDAKRVEASLSVGHNPYYLKGDGDHLYVSNLDDDTFSIIERTTFQVVNEINVPAGPYAIVLEEEE